jgi:hypothetical protein
MEAEQELKTISKDIKQWIHTNLWDQVPISISVIDRDFKICEANRMFLRTYRSW